VSENADCSCESFNRFVILSSGRVFRKSSAAETATIVANSGQIGRLFEDGGH
jgi:hypothetical protein